MKTVSRKIAQYLLAHGLSLAVVAGAANLARAQSNEWRAAGGQTRNVASRPLPPPARLVDSQVRPSGYWTSADTAAEPAGVAPMPSTQSTRFVRPSMNARAATSPAAAPRATSAPASGVIQTSGSIEATNYDPAPYAMAARMRRQGPAAPAVPNAPAGSMRPSYMADPAAAPASYRNGQTAFRTAAYDDVFSEGDQYLPQGEMLPTPDPMYQGEVIQGAPPYGPMHGGHAPWQDGGMHDGCSSCGGPIVDGGCSSCGVDCCDPCMSCWAHFFDPCNWQYDPSYFCSNKFPVCSPFDILNHASVSGGVTAFKGPLDQGLNGNFGFIEGLNTGTAIWHGAGLGAQMGVNFVQTNLSGSVFNGNSDNSRNQTFFTVGLFHRAFNQKGWQVGAVFDYMKDNYYVDSRLNQIRGEISYIAPRGHEIGFWGAFATQDDSQDNSQHIVEPIDLYTFFYRMNVCETAGQGRFWAGATGNGDGILGADFRAPASNRVDLIGGFNYIVPKDGKGAEGAVNEAWGMMMQIVFYPARRREGLHNNPYRPLFNVADNTNFILNRVTP